MREIEMKRSHGSVRALALFAYISVLIVSLSGCKDDKDGSSVHMGKVSLNLRADTTSLKKGIHSSVTKAVSDEFADFLTVDDYRILIVAGTDTAKQYDRFDKMPPEFDLPEGSYSLIASKGNNLPAEYENPYFEGSTDFTVKEGMSSPLDVTCSLGNTRIMAEYTDDFKEAYSEYTVLLSSANTTADFEIAKGETRPAYMQVAKDGTDIAVGIRLKKVNAEEEKTYYVPNAIKMERRQNVRLIFKTDGEALEGIGLDVMLDDSLATQSFTTKIPDFMWQQFKEPTLSPTGFKNGEEFELRSGLFTKDPYIGINMPGGIGSLIIKYWREGEQEEDATVYDLATDAGVKAAKEQHYTWFIGEDEDLNVSKKKVAVLHLQGGLNSLPSPLEGVYTYHYKVYGTDATGKANESNIVSFDVDVLSANAPQIVAEPASNDPYEIVEGDELSTDWKFEFTATGLIDEDGTKVVVNNGTSDSQYIFMKDNGNSLKTDMGAEVVIENNANATISFSKSFSSRLSVMDDRESQTYTFTFYLKDQNGKNSKVSKTITVKAPKFILKTNEGDAFAKRVVLRVNMPIGHKEKLTYQYKKDADQNWTAVNGAFKLDGDIQYVDTLKGLKEATAYRVRVVYNGVKEWYSDVVEVTTETPGVLPNGKLEKWSIAPDQRGNTSEGPNHEIKSWGKTISPFRYWEVWQPWSDDTNKGWNTLNLETTKEGEIKEGTVTFIDAIVEGAYPWTRYSANSGTIRTNGRDGGYAALIRTVGWGKGNSAVGETSAAVIKNITPGELYLGTNTSGENGFRFTSRPSALRFDYKYDTKLGTDHFVTEIVVKDGSGNEIASATLPASQATTQSSWDMLTIPIIYKGDNASVKAAQIYIRFVSSNSSDYNFLRDNLIDWPAQRNLSNGEYVGSKLYIDNVELIYE